ncbi:hypothetical protein O6H91_05G065900 [Diphasiastrum complanatum]|uniref:Uncharacterized protein n=1 Tax=Diphasiastrum complanatum TaxID=34168 RepID=A0ACC2DP02_DIPCM|nr:hypothetical protein O6H91_05G065900 [Diphasiastrum complanatum]
MAAELLLCPCLSSSSSSCPDLALASYCSSKHSSTTYGPIVAQLCLNSASYYTGRRRSTETRRSRSSSKTIPIGSGNFALSAKRDRCGIAIASLVEKEKDGPVWLRGAVSAATELLRIFSPDDVLSYSSGVGVPAESSYRSEVLGIQDVVALLQDDYKRSYFLTGKDLYRRNLKLLVPFYEKPSLMLFSIKEANWKLWHKWCPMYRLLTTRPSGTKDGSEGELSSGG